MRSLILLLLLPVAVFACGNTTPCACDDTVTENWTLSADFICPYQQDGASVITIGASNITLNLNGHRISAANSYVTESLISDGVAPDQTSICIGVVSGRTGVVITGAGTVSDCALGIVTASGVTIQNLTVSNTYLNAIRLSGGSSTVSGVTLSNNFGYPLRIDSNGNSVSSSTVSNNYSDIMITTGCALKFVGSVTGNTFTSVVFSANSSVYVCADTLPLSSTNTFATCQFNTRKLPLFLFSRSGTLPMYIAGMDTTNTADGLPIYMLKSVSGSTYDGTNMGYFGCESCSNVTIKNAVVTEVEIYNSTGTTVQSVTGAINVEGGSGNTVTTCTGSIRANSTTSSTISNNTATTAGLNSVSGIAISGASSGSVISGNTSRGFFIGVGSLTATGNSILYPTGISEASSMIAWSEVTRTANTGDTVSFSFSMRALDGTSCSTCAYSVATSPAETVSSSLLSSTVSGTFVPSKAGTYSLIVTVTDASGNSQKQNFLFLIGSTSSTTARMYLRYGRQANVAPGGGMDGQPLSLTAPSGTDYAGYCTGWVQHSPTDLPPYPFSLFTGASETLTYSVVSGSGASSPFVALTRFTGYNNSVDSAHSTVAATGKYVIASTSPTAWSGLTWMMDGARSWTRLATKLVSPTIHYPQIQSTSGTPSYIDLTYSYSTNPAVKSVSNLDAVLLAATVTGGVSTLTFDSVATGAQTVSLTGMSAQAVYNIAVDSGTASAVVSDSTGLLSFTTPSLAVGSHAVTVQLRPTRTLIGQLIR